MTRVNEVLTKYLIKDSAENDTKIKVAANIKVLLGNIDLNAEHVPENNGDMFKRLISSLKGQPLNSAETELINEITR